MTLVIQIDGRTRALVELPTGTAEIDAVAAARSATRDALDGGDVRRVVFVPDRLVNFVTA